jgi:uncharacterized protein
MIIKYTNFSDGIYNIKFRESVKNLGLEEPFEGYLDVNCRMDKSAHQIVLDCDISVDADMTCDRCDADFKTTLTNKFRISYLFGKTSEKIDEYNLKILSDEQDKIDIKNDVVEYANLSIPMKRLCSDDCKGLCSQCGRNLNEGHCRCKRIVDRSVWEPLNKLKGKLNN